MYLEADFRREYGIDLLPWIAQGVTWRRFLALIRGLSANSTWFAMADRNAWLTSEQAAERTFERW